MQRLAYVTLNLTIIGLFLAAGRLWPRQRQPVLTGDTWLCIVFSLWLDLCRYVVFAYLVRERPPLLDLSVFDRHPLLQFMVLFLLEDFCSYWIHVAQHRVSFLWWLHRVHHSTRFLDAAAAERVHPLENLGEGLFFFLLYGRSATYPVILSYTLLRWTMGAYRHSNISMPMQSVWARTWNAVLNNPHFHGWHHACDAAAYHCNYGLMLTIWDRLFGTLLRTDAPPSAFGLPPSERLRNTFLGLNLLRQ